MSGRRTPDRSPDNRHGHIADTLIDDHCARDARSWSAGASHASRWFNILHKLRPGYRFGLHVNARARKLTNIYSGGTDGQSPSHRATSQLRGR
jgi:hypothetical protein